MSAFPEVVDYIVGLIGTVWVMVVGNWILSLFMLIAILGLIANLIKSHTGG